MTTAILSFAIPGSVTLRCDAAGIDGRRTLEANPPFTAWSRLYATGYWRPEALLGLGLAIGAWLDGAQQWLALLVLAPGPVVLQIETAAQPSAVERAALDVPWELIARVDANAAAAMAVPAAVAAPSRDVKPSEPRAVTELLANVTAADLQRATHLALDPGLALTAVRYIGAARTPRVPSQYRLSVAFMAAQPDGLTGLEVDREEVEIRRATGAIGMDLAVEDSGSLARLGELVAQAGECDVVHLSCHGAAGGSTPVLALEGPLGERVDADAQDLSLGIGQTPRLMFLSACSSAESCGELWSLSADLCRRGWPAVLGWSCTVSDPGAITLASALYRQLALKVPLVEALTKARLVFAYSGSGAEWHKARLFLGPSGGGVIVAGTRPRPGQPNAIVDREYLDQATFQIPVYGAEEVFPHRRAFQRAMAALRDGNYNGVVVHGADEIARATFAQRLLRRVELDLPRVVVAVDFDAAAIVSAIATQTASAGVAAIAAQYRDALRTDPSQLLQALRAIVEGPCRDAGAGAFVLVLHGFDPAAPPNPALAPTRLPIARALIGAFTNARTASRLVFTSAAPFSVAGNNGDLAATLLVESLDPA